MARTIKFAWTEIDQTIIKEYRDSKSVVSGKDGTGRTSTQNTLQTSDVTDTGAYRLQGVSVGSAMRFSIQCDLLEDIDLEMGSTFEGLGEMVPGISSLLGFVGSVNNAFSGLSPEILNVFNIPRWKETAPLVINISPVFYTRKNSITDVLLPMMSLASATIIKRVPTAIPGEKPGDPPKTGYVTFRTPGVFLGNIGQAAQRTNSGPTQGGEKNLSEENQNPGVISDKADQAINSFLSASNGGFVAVEIPGIIGDMKAGGLKCLLEKCKPKFSKQITESGGPLWGTLEMTLRTFLPASSAELFSGFGSLRSPETAPGLLS